MTESRLLILCQLFYPELVSTGLTVTELAEALVAQGVDVEVVCGPLTLVDRHTDVPRRMTHRGIRIFRVWGTRFPKLSLIGKLVNHLTYSASVLGYLMRAPLDRPILVFTNPPFLAGACAAVSLFRRRLRFIYVVFDVYPDTGVQAGLLSKFGLITRIWHAFNRFCFTRASRIVVIGRCMEALIAGRLPENQRQKLVKIHVWSDDLGIQSGGQGPSRFREKWKLGDDFVLGYSGNLGRFHDIDTLVKAAAELKELSRLQFLFVGEGHAKGPAQQFVASHQLNRCQFHTYVPREELGELLTTFDVGLVALNLGQEGLSVPSKTYGLMAAGIPIIAVMAATSEIALTIREAGCGWVVDPGDVDGLVAVIHQAMAITKEELIMMGQKGRAYSMTHCTLGRAADMYRELISSERV